MVSDDPIETRMLSALELFHYESRFRNKLFVIALEPEASLRSIITDLRILQASDIRVLVLCLQEPEQDEDLRRLNLRGGKFSPIEHRLGEGFPPELPKQLREFLRGNRIPIITLAPPADADARSDRAATARTIALHALDLAERLSGIKVFVLSTFRGLEVDGVLQSHPSEEDVAQFLSSNASINIGKDQLAFIQEQNRKRKMEIVLLDAKSGSLFQEIFTHRGRGTLFTKNYPNIVRRGELRDVTDISFLMKPSIAAGTMLPLSEDELAEHVHEFFVYTINGALVASAWLVDYGAWAEAAKICTLPRFQGKGRARQLVLRLMDEARAQGKECLFSLSIEPKMWAFFESLGFHEISREELPERWRAQYDLTRSSRAFIVRLN